MGGVIWSEAYRASGSGVRLDCPMSTSFHLTAGVLAIEIILYALSAAVALRIEKRHERSARWLAIYAIAAGFWTSGQVLYRLGWLASIPGESLARFTPLTVALLAWFFLHLTHAFLRLGQRSRAWWVSNAVCVAGLVFLASNFFLPETAWPLLDWNIGRHSLFTGVSVIGWAALVGGAGLLTVRAYRQTQQPLHKNRITYWSLVWSLIVAADGLLLLGYLLPGSALRTLAMPVAAYVITLHRPADIRQIVRKTATYLLITLLAMSLYLLGFATLQYVFQAVPGYNQLLAGAVVALVLAVVYQPLLALVQRVMRRLIGGTAYDANRILHEYSTSISNILDLELLANVMVNLISDAFKIGGGRLFVVDREEENARDSFLLREVGSAGKTEASLARLASHSPIATYLRQERRSLTQYDIDLLDRFKAISSDERAWLSSLNADVYVPIHAKGEWIGLLALSPKVSGDLYFDEDLALLATLADQTAVALENARLVEDLVRAQDDLGQAYAALAQANRQLQELDKLKSAFIGVITHELRTPFANIAFSLELLERHGWKHLPPELDEPVAHLVQGIASARTMVDNLVTFATLLSKQGELHPTPLDLCQVVEESLVPLKPLAESRGVTLHPEVPEEPVELKADRDRLGDAVYHLVHNAIKFTGAGGQVWVRCQAVDHAARFEVQDTGVGVPADRLPVLWEGFAQMSDPLRRGVEGLGLGLALVKYVVNAHGGEVFAESEEGVGSRFGFHIPLRS
ncbi:MAG: hypothetical protein Kow0063_27030 [Anaerolineae bacterium]